MDADEFLNAEGSLAEEIRTHILDEIVDHERNRPRSVQEHLGPSEAGSPCARKLAFSMTGTKSKGSNVYTEVLPSMTGTALHATMESVLARMNTKEGYQRWLSEVKVTDPIAGTCDCYDTLTGTVVDWKFLGKSTYDKFKRHGASPEYRGQRHLYGLGLKRMGYDVKNVALMIFNRPGKLRDAIFDMEPFDEAFAISVAERLFGIEKITAELDMLHHPYRFRFIPATPGDACFFCPFFNAMADGRNPWECVGTAGDPNVGLSDWKDDAQ